MTFIYISFFIFLFILSFIVYYSCFFFFFFSSRRRHTRCSRDWSSDVCSSDLVRLLAHPTLAVALAGRGAWIVMVLLLDELAVFNAKCVEGIKRLAVREANLGLPGNPAAIAGVVMQEFKAADCGQDAGEKIEIGRAHV